MRNSNGASLQHTNGPHLGEAGRRGRYVTTGQGGPFLAVGTPVVTPGANVLCRQGFRGLSMTRLSTPKSFNRASRPQLVAIVELVRHRILQVVVPGMVILCGYRTARRDDYSVTMGFPP